MENKTLKQLIVVASSTAFVSGTAVVIGWVAATSIKSEYLSKWYLPAIAGCAGSIIGARYNKR